MSNRERIKLRLVILFGSGSRGDHTDASYVDILVVADDLPQDLREAFAALRNPWCGV